MESSDNQSLQIFCPNLFVGNHAALIISHIIGCQNVNASESNKKLYISLQNNKIEDLSEIMNIFNDHLAKAKGDIFKNQQCDLSKEIEQIYSEVLDFFDSNEKNPSRKSSIIEKLVNLSQKALKLITERSLSAQLLLLLESNRAFSIGFNDKNFDQENFEFKLFQQFVSLRESLFNPEFNYYHISSSVENHFFSKYLVLKDKSDDLYDLIRCNNMMLRKYIKDSEGNDIIYDIPMNLWITPTKITLKKYDEIRNKMLDWNYAVVSMYKQRKMIFKKLRDLKADQEDKFLAKLLEISDKKEEIPENLKGNLNLLVLRNDYLHDFENQEWFQVEINLMASGSPINGDNCKNAIKWIYDYHFKEEALNKQYFDIKNIEIIKGFQETMEIYGNTKGYIVFFVPEKEGNIYDQRIMEFEMNKRGMKTIRLNFSQLIERINYNEKTNRCYLSSDFTPENELVIFYMRHGFIEKHYIDEEHWKARELIEISKCVSIPSAEYQILNFKKIQQFLQEPEFISAVTKSPEQAKLLAKNFAPIWKIESQEDKDMLISKVQSNHLGFVLKPSKEGGGNNFFGKDIISQAEKMSVEDLKSYILMQRITGLPKPSVHFIHGKVIIDYKFNEISFYSYLINDAEGILKEGLFNTMVRSKNYKNLEGGLMVGSASYDTLFVE